MKYLLFILCGLLLQLQFSSGIDVNVTSGLSDAIAVANDGDTIVIPAGTYTGDNNTNLSLYGRILSFRSESGVASDVIIDCGNATSIMVQYNDSLSPLNNDKPTTLSFSGITFTNCNANLGAVMSFNSTNTTANCSVSISNCEFHHNKGGKGGGAIYAVGSLVSVQISNSKLYENNGYYGGAIFAENGASFVITDSSFKSNRGQEGGSLYFADETLMTIVNSEFIANRARDDAGAIYLVYNSIMDISGTTFENNTAGTGGGALNIESSECWITNSTFRTNTAVYGGALLSRSLHGTVILSNTLFDNNLALSTGGAICVSANSRLSIADSTLTYNDAYSGGALAVIVSGLAYLKSVNLVNNSAAEGGGFYVQDSSDLIVDNSVLTNNFALNNGDSIFCSNSEVKVNSTQFNNPSVRTDEDYGVFCSSLPAYTWCKISSQGSGNWSNVCVEPDRVITEDEIAGWKVGLIAAGSIVGALLLGFFAAYLISKRFHAPAFFHQIGSPAKDRSGSV